MTTTITITKHEPAHPAHSQSGNRITNLLYRKPELHVLTKKPFKLLALTTTSAPLSSPAAHFASVITLISRTGKRTDRMRSRS